METEKFESVLCKFIGDFPVGNNMVRNADALRRMHENNESSLFNKLMLVQAGSIVEASLDQIFYRAKTHTKEGLPEIPDEERKKIAEKEAERFATIIDVMKGHKLLDGLGVGIYDELHKLRQYPNRIQIQLDDKPTGISRRENEAFTKDIVEWSFNLCIRVLKHLTDRYPRPKDLEQYAHEIKLPNAL